jgi:Protein of unknown function (DUF2778)
MLYQITTGILYDDNENVIAHGYSGNGEYKNNPDAIQIVDHGPIPIGSYLIGKPYDSPHTGNFTLPLEPFGDNEMFGRSEFKIHGDSIDNPGTASNGCIILPHDIRVWIDEQTDKTLEVIK